MDLQRHFHLRELASPIPVVITVDASPAFCLQYVPDGGTGGAAATAALVQNATMTMLVDAAAPTGADAIGTNGVIDTSNASYDTVGELQATFNATAAWRCYRIGAIGSTAMAGILAKSATSCIGANGLFFYFDGSASNLLGFAFSGERFVSNSLTGGHMKDADHECLNSLHYLKWASAVTITNGAINIYSDDQSTPTGGETLMFTTSLPTAGTAREYGEANPAIPWITAKRGERLVVQISTPSGTPTPTNLHAIGSTVVLSGAYIVDEVQW